METDPGLGWCLWKGERSGEGKNFPLVDDVSLNVSWGI